MKGRYNNKRGKGGNVTIKRVCERGISVFASVGTVDKRVHAPLSRKPLAIHVWAAVLAGSGAPAGRISVAHACGRAHTRRVAVATIVRRCSHSVGTLVVLGVEVRLGVRLEMLLLVVAGGAGVGVSAGRARRGATVGSV